LFIVEHLFKVIPATFYWNIYCQWYTVCGTVNTLDDTMWSSSECV